MDGGSGVARRRKGSRGPEGIGEILKRSFAIPARRQVASAERVRRKWGEVAGPEIAGKTSVVSFRRGVLRVRVSSSALLAELDGIYKKDLIAALAEGAEPVAVRAMEFELIGASVGG